MSDGKNVTAENHRLMKLATYASVITASLLIVTKLVAWFMTDSMSLMATLLDSTMDILASLITLFAVRIAITPADDDHHFGHGKAENLAALAQSAFIAGSAIVLLLHVLDRAADSENVLHNEYVGIFVMMFSVVATLVLLAIQRYVVQKTGSAVIKADSLHYQMDLFSNMAVLLALVGANLGLYQMDNLFALLIGSYMLYSVKNQAWESIQQLMDHSLPEEALQEIEKRALSVPGVIGMHDLKTRISGTMPFIQMHLNLDGSLPLKQAHDLGSVAKWAVLEYMPEADIIVHLDPED
ncbi:divalent metal cation transporter FieF [Endozoicomonas sp. (ex Bugula neritina AB1)]|nr:divalent metal cation transporter FieF [Endozoicomonas sp. (ex Bugula neritina AB1)]